MRIRTPTPRHMADARAARSPTAASAPAKIGLERFASWRNLDFLRQHSKVHYRVSPTSPRAAADPKRKLKRRMIEEVEDDHYFGGTDEHEKEEQGDGANPHVDDEAHSYDSDDLDAQKQCSGPCADRSAAVDVDAILEAEAACKAREGCGPDMFRGVHEVVKAAGAKGSCKVVQEVGC